MANPKRRLDAELVRRKIARSREQASTWIRDGLVTVNGMKAQKPATMVTPEVSIKVAATEDEGWASRGAHKLIGALDAFGVEVADRVVLDAGASTGGFTDVCLRRGAKLVYAVDVGYGQLVWRLRDDERVAVHDRTNVRYLTPETLGGQADVMVGDLSFISLKLVLPALVDCIRDGGDLLPMIKPQFEVGKDRLGAGGVVRSAQLRREAVLDVARFAQTLNTRVKAVVASPLPGPSGNVEYFLWLEKGASACGAEELEAMVDTAIAQGPQ